VNKQRYYFREAFFCEQGSQKTRELRREIMRMHDFCASRSVLLVTFWLKCQKTVEDTGENLYNYYSKK